MSDLQSSDPKKYFSSKGINDSFDEIEFPQQEIYTENGKKVEIEPYPTFQLDERIHPLEWPIFEEFKQTSRTKKIESGKKKKSKLHSLPSTQEFYFELYTLISHFSYFPSIICFNKKKKLKIKKKN